MLKIINYDLKQLNKILNKKKFDSNEANVVCMKINGQKMVIKILKDLSNTKNKEKKIRLIHEIFETNEYIVTANYIIMYNGKFIGYAMPFIKGKLINKINVIKKDKAIRIIKNISNTLKELHVNNIVCGDFNRNIIIKNNKCYFIDHDNFSINKLPIDFENIYLKEYKKNINTFDYKFDNYLLNLLTISILCKTYLPYIYTKYKIKPDFFEFEDEEIYNIIKNTFNLKESYDEELIIDKIKTKKEIKKIKIKI